MKDFTYFRSKVKMMKIVNSQRILVIVSCVVILSIFESSYVFFNFKNIDGKISSHTWHKALFDFFWPKPGIPVFRDFL